MHSIDALRALKWNPLVIHLQAQKLRIKNKKTDESNKLLGFRLLLFPNFYDCSTLEAVLKLTYPTGAWSLQHKIRLLTRRHQSLYLISIPGA
jgi:hypothetical protein